MTIDEMLYELEIKVRDTYIVTLKYKYDFEENYTIENHILEYDSITDSYVWLNDWNEGQTDVEVLGYILLGDVDTTKVEPCEDSISRDAVMKCFKKWQPYMATRLLGYEQELSKLPSVTPQHTRWIPVSERLPEPQKGEDKNFSEWVLITSYIGKNDYVVGRAYYCFSDKKWYAERFGCGKVIAWMPLPEPYRESEVNADDD